MGCATQVLFFKKFYALPSLKVNVQVNIMVHSVCVCVCYKPVLCASNSLNVFFMNLHRA